MRKDLEKAAQLVRDGLTYQQTADRLKLTRHQVAGACTRAGVRTGRPTGARTDEGLRAVRDGTKRWWREATQEQLAAFSAKAAMGSRNRWRKWREQRATSMSK